MSTDDHFTSVASAYKASRPDYPDALYDWLQQQVSPAAASQVWDVGCGSGQASVALAERGYPVFATDLSASQIGQATPHPKVCYAVAEADSVALADQSCDMITVAQAAHWFDMPSFCAEAKRVAKPGAMLAIWTYERPRLPADLDSHFERFHRGTLGSYWPARRAMVDDGYASLDFPYERLPAPNLQIDRQWTLEQLLGYAASWSATGRYRKQQGRDPIPDLASQLKPYWPESGTIPVFWPMHILATRL